MANDNYTYNYCNDMFACLIRVGDPPPPSAPSVAAELPLAPLFWRRPRRTHCPSISSSSLTCLCLSVRPHERLARMRRPSEGSWASNEDSILSVKTTLYTFQLRSVTVPCRCQTGCHTHQQDWGLGQRDVESAAHQSAPPPRGTAYTGCTEPVSTQTDSESVIGSQCQ